MEINTMPNSAPLRRPAIKDIAGGVFMLLASRASVMGMFPFGTAFFAAGFDKGIAYIGIAVMCGGLISAGAGILAVKYLIADLLYWIYIKTRRDESRVIEATVCGLSVLVGGAVMFAYDYIGIYDVMLLFIESIISAVVYIVFVNTKAFLENRRSRSYVSQEEMVSIAVCAGVFITGLSGIKLPYGINPAAVAAMYVSMCIALCSNLAAAGSGAMCIGFMSALSSPLSALTGGADGLGALFGNFLKNYGRIGAAVGFVGGIAAVSICMQGGAEPLSAVDAAVAALLFVITPKKIHKYINIFFSKSLRMEAVSADVRIKEYLSGKTEHIAEAFNSLKKCFCEESDKRINLYRSEVGGLFDEMSHRVCAGCSMAVKCWNNDFTKTYKSVMSLLNTIETEGILTVSSVPKSFKDKCIRSDVFVSELNHVYELYKKRLIRAGEAVAERNIIARQYEETAKIFENLSTDILEGFSFREDLEESVVNALDKLGITAYEVSVVENTVGKTEVYLGLGLGADIKKAEAALCEIFSVPMGRDKEYGGALMKFVSKPKYSADVSLRQIKSDEAEISGDSTASFTTENYKKYIIIADGMGSGKKAMQESRATLRLLREFLMAGFEAETAIEMINSSLCLKMESEMFSTIDLLCIDLIYGTAEFYKIGAAESLISRSGNIETVFSVSMPAGIVSDIKPQGQIKRVYGGDMIVMMSDGVTEAEDGTVRTEWIKQKLRSAPTDAEETAQDIMETVIEKSHGMILDDMTVAVVKITEN